MSQIRDVDDAIEYDGDYEFTSDREVRQYMKERRDSDNQGALIRWARKKCEGELKGMSDKEKLDFFYDIMPDTLHGRHAVSHIESALRLEPDPNYRSGWRKYSSSGRGPSDEAMRETLREILMSIIETGQQSRLNSRLKNVTPEDGHKTNKVLYITSWGTKIYERKRCDDCQYRIFTGLGQMNEFIDFLMRHRGYRMNSTPNGLGIGHGDAFLVVWNWKVTL